MMVTKTAASRRHQHFGNQLRVLRLQRGLTQLALGQAMGWQTGSAINQMEQGTYNPTLEVIYRLAAVLKVPPGELFTEPLDRHAGPDPECRPLDLQGLSPPLQDTLTALVTTLKQECPHHPSS
jgi:transcriptional regulator with XRE-family HTH domain